MTQDGWRDGGKAGGRCSAAVGAAVPIADLGPGDPRWTNTPNSRSPLGYRFTSAIHKGRGTLAAARTPTDCCDSTFRKAPTSPVTAHRPSPRTANGPLWKPANGRFCLRRETGICSW
jgi:hypothetical protein